MLPAMMSASLHESFCPDLKFMGMSGKLLIDECLADFKEETMLLPVTLILLEVLLSNMPLPGDPDFTVN